MDAVLICPSERPAGSLLAEHNPLAGLPILGETPLEYWLCHLAGLGLKNVLVLAEDRPEAVQELAGDGGRWGLSVEVLAEGRELAPAQALLKHAEQLGQGSAPPTVEVLDHLPGQPAESLFSGYGAFFAAILAWLPHAQTPDRIGVREVQPGVFVGLHSRISKEARLHAPCWVGRDVLVGPKAVLGPEAFVEDGALIEATAEIHHSWISADTFVGRFARVRNSLALGHLLINWQTGSCAAVEDPFLLSALRSRGRPRAPRKAWGSVVGNPLPELTDPLASWSQIQADRKL